MRRMTAPSRSAEPTPRRGAAVAMLVVASLALAASPGTRAAPELRPNPNTASAGVLKNGVLTLTLDAAPSAWRFSKTHRPMTVAAFSELGKPPLMPGPLVRVPVGTELKLTIHNSLDKPLSFAMPAALHGGEDVIGAVDSVVIAPGASNTISARATVPGNYVYRGAIPDGAAKISHRSGVLGGAIIVDTAARSAPAHDQVFVIMATEDSVSSACDDTTTGPRARVLTECRGRRFMYTINGTEWPATPRIHATVGDSLHWRVINASAQDHPMHLHGFYFRVDELTGPLVEPTTRPAPGQLVVTQLLTAQSSMSITWSPERPGNWLFHCHFALHNTPYALDAMPDDPEMHDMAGLVLGVIVAPRRGSGVVAAGSPAPTRRLRLVAEQSAVRVGGVDTLPTMHFVLEENGRRVDTHTDLSPQIDLVRGEPVAITIVNHAAEPTSVHWHGVEVEDSYMDGAAGFSGAGQHLAPAIAPGDSFVARFTPPRAGTFMYHAHVDDLMQQAAGMEGALIVRDGATPSSVDDHILFLKGRGPSHRHPLEINGRAVPDTVVLRAGRPSRLRLINLSMVNIAPIVSLTARTDSAASIVRDTMLVRWRPLAKDGFDLPNGQRAQEPARVVISIGETYDFEYTPKGPGALWLEFRNGGAAHRLLIRVPIRVE